MKLTWSLFAIGVCLLAIFSVANSEPEQPEEQANKNILVRTIRGARDKGKASGNNGGSAPSCRYNKGQWSDCDTKNNTRTRVLTLKKGDKSCERTKTITKKCKKACRYEKGTWGDCVNQQMIRTDSIKPKSDPTCEKSRRITKRCKSEGNEKPKKNNDRGHKKAGKQ